jgi:3-oxoacyl-[acyl-carrier-protein] synthase III
MRVSPRRGLRALATGIGLPRAIVSTADRLAALAPDRVSSAERTAHVVQSLGVATRGVVASDEDSISLGVLAARQALTGQAPPDLLLFCSSTSPSWTGSGASNVAAALELPPLLAFDVKAGCSSSLHALALTGRLLQEGQTALIVGADTWTRASPDADRGAALTLGDAGAAVLIGTSGDAEAGLLSGALGTWPQHRDAMGASGRLPPGVFPPQRGDFQVTGDPARLRIVLPEISDAIRAEALQGYTGPIDRLLAHAGAPELIHRNAMSWGIPQDRVHHPLERYGNCGAANLLLAWHRLRDAAAGETWLLHAVAGGISAGAMVWRT